MSAPISSMTDEQAAVWNELTPREMQYVSPEAVAAVLRAQAAAAQRPAWNEAQEGEFDVEGVEGGIAILKRTKWSASLDLYGEDGEPYYGSLPVNTPVAIINQVIHLIQRAEKRGEEWGKRQKQHEVLAVLGIEKPFDLMKKLDD